ncbi:MAG: type II/IV secretion system ATPase subunit [Candidatus Aenigmatarchaeota archaeon]
MVVCNIEEIKEGNMRVHCLGCIFGSSVEDFDVCMATTIDKLIQQKDVREFTLASTREYHYPSDQTKLLKEIANAYVEILNEKKLVSLNKIIKSKELLEYGKIWYNWLQDLVHYQLRGDPIGAYVNLIREIRHLKAKAQHEPQKISEGIMYYLENTLIPIKEILEKCQLIQISKPHLTAYHIGSRDLYRQIFRPSTRPNFMFTKYMTVPPRGEIIDRYNVGDSLVEIYKVTDKVRPVYFITPPEFRLSEEQYLLLDAARQVLEKRRPRELELREQEKMRELFYNIGIELIKDLSEQMHISISSEETEKLARILTRYTAGLGILELLLADEKIQDIYSNSPLGISPIFINHQDFDECETNLIPTKDDGERWATRFKLISGRPLDEANPVLDTEISVPGGVARVAAINPHLSPDGLAFALRRHRFKPWTFPLFMNLNFFNPLCGGLLWFLTEYGRTILVAGTRGTGKTSLLGSLMLQILPSYRIVTCEDTLELPVEALRELGYNVQRLKSRSVITKIEFELSAEDALRTALRLGDSCLFLGEVRSVEAKALYEAMRVGALANVVAGTIHGESAYGVFDRVVNDLGVPITSFKATDIVVIANKIRSPDGLKSYRRVVEITEIRKHWQRDPVEENGFINLMEYDVKEDTLKPTDILLNGESMVLNSIANRIPGWAGRWDLVWDNIQLRANILKTMVDISRQTKNLEILEAPMLIKVNQMFHKFAEESRKEIGIIDSKRVFDLWLEWFKKEAKSTT